MYSPLWYHCPLSLSMVYWSCSHTPSTIIESTLRVKISRHSYLFTFHPSLPPARIFSLSRYLFTFPPFLWQFHPALIFPPPHRASKGVSTYYSYTMNMMFMDAPSKFSQESRALQFHSMSVGSPNGGDSEES